MLQRAGIDPARDVSIGPVPGAAGEKASFGLMAAQALEEGKIDGFWANGMGAEVAVRNGIGTLVLDARRDGSEEFRGYTFPALVTTEKQDPKAAAAAVRAIVAAQKALKEDPDRATAVAGNLPPTEAGLIAELIRRDAPSMIDDQQKRSRVDESFRAGHRPAIEAVPYEQVVWKP